MEYREHTVPAALRRHVQCVWRLRDRSSAALPQTIFPDGRCELIVHLGRPPRAWDPAHGWHVQPRVLFAAQFRTAVRLQSRGDLDCVGIRLMPAASAAAVGAPLAGLRDRIHDLSKLAPRFARPLAEAARRFAEAAEDRALAALLEAQLTAYPVDARIERAVQRLLASDGRERIESTAAAVGMSVRNLQVRFLRCVGLGAKEFARVQRLQATLRSLDADATQLAQIASEAGFADQAHATREIARITGSTPAALRRALRNDREGDATIRLAAAFVRGHTLADAP
jgi:AraC-like DNA-binding protein